MDNGERGRRLMAMATEYLQDMEASYGRKSWNAVVRRAQEVVELSLKGVLSSIWGWTSHGVVATERGYVEAASSLDS